MSGSPGLVLGIAIWLLGRDKEKSRRGDTPAADSASLVRIRL
jgi:hypothetical protein